ncbi:uncharacterized protein F4822DRAFT_213280 [Hypoxylon trugodes]|uniref:uncharacterized protein n=1 Tax=Hypoxylon trugodes TaxID=326681 RepID=UPI0021961789|nr:uncharacterized protein F4822DRAFT_213280 [Hypoxylon trugodes]KAI1389782.1 hypothetical protein F4822DRAFT_213280 [Hypoxylon trugodes]
MADHLSLTPSGSSDTVMEGHSRVTKMAALSFGTSPDLAGLDRIDRVDRSMDMNLPFRADRNHPDSYGPRQGVNRLALWYHRNDGPWTPPGLTSPQSDLRNPSIIGNLRGSPLGFSSQYRESIVPSECDTVPPGVIPSDSGYGGSYGAKHSVANGSVCEESLERNPETQSLIGHIGELNFRSYNQDMVSKGGINPESAWPSLQQPHPSSSSSAIDHQINLEGNRICEVCHKLLKTKSELKKHKQRHDKPFKCNVNGCTRREGFSTPNDLDRHKRSLHPDEGASGSRYRCPVGACKHKDKIWPRADNFRAHMKRVHQKDSISDEDLDQYKIRPTLSPKEGFSSVRDSTAHGFDRFSVFPVGNTSYASENSRLPRSPVIELSTEASPVEGRDHSQPEAASTVNKFASEDHLRIPNNSAVGDVRPENNDIYFDKQAVTSNQPLTTPNSALDDTKVVKPRLLKESDSDLNSVNSDSELDGNVKPLGHYKTDTLNEPQNFPGVSSNEGSEPHGELEVSIDINEKIHAFPGARDLEMGDIDLTNRDNVAKILEKLQSNGMLEKLGYKRGNPPDPETTKEEPIGNVPSEAAHACPTCHKSFSRRCELKKHEKRHLKPYGCTFPGCDKKFGSKNDWKRHENSQHYMLEHWRCDEKFSDGPSKVCGKSIYRRELFKQHLNTVHHISNQGALEAKLEMCRVGRNCEARFWCGFCYEIIEIKKEGIEAWTERFNHIDDHFHGRNNLPQRHISDWENECSHLSRPQESTPDDTGNSRATMSAPACSTDTSNMQGQHELEKQHIKQKRKRDDGRDALVSKRVETLQEMPRRNCCTTVSCQHRLCRDCY